jgi:hypothetical protein
MRGRVAKALRRTNTSFEKPGDLDIVLRMAARRQHEISLLPKRQPAARQRKPKDPQPMASIAWKRTSPPIVQKPLRALRQYANDDGLQLGQYLRLKTEFELRINKRTVLRSHIRGENHAGAQPKWLLDRMAIAS